MALPDPRTNHEDFVHSLHYFKASVAADPKTAALAPRLAESLSKVKASNTARLDTDEAELDARAVRDYINRKGDAAVSDFRRELAGVASSKHPMLEDVFPHGVKYVTAPTGEEQVSRLEDLLRDLDLAAQSPRLETDPRKEKITRVLTEGRAATSAYLNELRDAVTAWKTAEVAATLATDRALQARQDAYAEAGSVLGRLRELCGGSESAAQAYTLPGQSKKKPTTKEPEDLPSNSI